MSYLLTSESVSEGHPDKVADQISDAVLDKLLVYDPSAHVACETLVTTGLVVISGEVTTQTYVDLKTVARQTIRRIGYTKSEYQFDADGCAVINAIQEQSGDIARGVNRSSPLEQGAGDQGIIFGYATNETPSYMPLPLYLANSLLIELARLRRMENSPMPYLRPDAKSQVTVEYDDDGTPLRIDTIVLSTQHDEFVTAAQAHGRQEEADALMLERIRHDIQQVLIPAMLDSLDDERIRRLFDGEIKFFVNPTGKFVIGGPHGDTGLTGRKIIVDTYGGKCPHGGGAFSGKDPSKVDRSAAYAARHIAKNMVAAGVADEMLVQISYAIGVARPVSIYVNTYGRNHVNMSDGEIARRIDSLFDLRPYAIERDLKLRQPIYEETAAYGHMGREPQVVTKHFDSIYNGEKDVTVELFTWEKLDAVDRIRKEFGL